MAKSLAEAHLDALRARFGDDATPLEALWTGANMFLLVFAQVKVLQYVREMFLRAALNDSMKPFDPTVLDKLAGADPVVQEAVVRYSSHSGNSDIAYPDSLGGVLLCAFDFRNASARLQSNLRKMEKCFARNGDLDASQVVPLKRWSIKISIRC